MPKGIPNKRYTGEFKQMVVETMMREKLSYCETARQFDISDHHRVTSWERIYLTEGPEGLYIERRGRGSKGRPAKFPKEVEEDLLKEVQRLRAENAYLKKLQLMNTDSRILCGLLKRQIRFLPNGNEIFIGFAFIKHITYLRNFCSRIISIV